MGSCPYAEIESRFMESVAYTSEFTWSIKEGLKVGAESTVKIEAPMLGESGVKFSAEISLESTQEQKKSDKQTWEQEVSIKVPAKTSIEATTVLQEGNVDTPFTITLIATGSAKIVKHTDGSSAENTGTLERGWGSPGPPPSKWLADDNARKFKAKGVFKAVNGLYITVSTKDLGKV